MPLNDRTYCLVPDCDEQPYTGDELCPTHQDEPWSREDYENEEADRDHQDGRRYEE
jgi:hypothetical protein